MAMDPQYTQQQEGGVAPHPYLHEPLLYISNLPAYVTDENLALAFVTCGPFRPKIARDTGASVLAGTIEFKFLEKAEKALATLQSRPIPGLQTSVPLALSPYPATTDFPTPLPPPSALPRLVKHMPPGFTDSQLYDLFRPFGALASVRAHTQFGPDTGMVEFWNEEDARMAEEAMHCAEIEGQNIAVQVYQQRRTSGAEFNVTAPAFVPSGNVFQYTNQQYSPPTPPHRQSYSPRSPPAPVPFVHGPGQQVQLAPLSGPGSTSHSGLIDPCNLFCKNLDSDIDSNILFSHFRHYGQIVSARVMRNENGESRGFGFVSYQAPDQAAAALHAMNGVQLGSKQIIVRLHEPRQLRQEKLAQRFSGHNGHPRSSSGATSPTLSEGGESMGGWGSPRQRSVTLGSPGAHDKERGRRGSGSYYNAALNGTLNFSMRYDDLSSLTPVVRKEVLTGDLSRRVKAMGTVDPANIDTLVDALVGISLSDVVACIEDPVKLANKVETLKLSLNIASPPKSRSPSVPASRDSSSDPNNLAATASAPEYPSTPISGNGSISTPPRTSSPSGSVPPTSERDRMIAAVKKLETTRQSELTDLLMSLPKRERAMCLFNVEVLRAKLDDAKLVLESEEDEDAANETQKLPVTPQSKRTAAKVQDSPVTPDLSSRGPSATSSPMPSTPAGPTHTIAGLAKLPAAEIIRIVSSPTANIPVSKADPLVQQATDEFIDGLLDKPSSVQKQQLGEKLFKVVKSFGIKGAPKITVALLDQEDLRALAHLMNSYPAVLKDKAQALVVPK